MNVSQADVVEVVVPYYLSQGYNKGNVFDVNNIVVVPYYLSQGYNVHYTDDMRMKVVVPYYLSQGYNLVKIKI